jgi:excinuclease ABC subunit C
MPPPETSSTFDAVSTLAVMPHSPGCYLMRDRQGRIVYVGKASDLKNRVRSYFQSDGDRRPFVQRLPEVLGEIDVIVCENEKEAVILEATLIKKHRPRYNVQLKDDKRFLCLRIDTAERWPRVEVVRKPRQDKARYFGPYHSATSIRRTLHVLNRHFQLRTCDDTIFSNRTRPCLQYQIKRCPAPCVLEVDQTAYKENVRQAMLFLEGRNEELLQTLEKRMLSASEELAFERAARYRDQIRAIDATLAKQQVVAFEAIDRDVFGSFRLEDRMVIQVLQVRVGRLVATRSFSFSGLELDDADVLGSFLGQYYLTQTSVPSEILLPIALVEDEKRALQSYLSQRRTKKVGIHVPKRGDKKSLINTASTNAQHTFRKRFARREETPVSLDELQKRLFLKRVPKRIECYDISQLQGKQTVASMVVFVDGARRPQLYRRFHIRSLTTQDDFASLREVLLRRLKRVTQKDGDPPDLVIIDGGKGQLSQATYIAEQLEIDDIDFISLAKSRVDKSGFDSATVSRSRERVFLKGRKNPVLLEDGPLLYLLQRIRDEAHRFAITFHKQVRRKEAVASALDDIPGIGAKTRRSLLVHFGGLERIRSATTEELAEVPGVGKKTATTILTFLRNQNTH